MVQELLRRGFFVTNQPKEPEIDPDEQSGPVSAAAAAAAAAPSK